MKSLYRSNEIPRLTTVMIIVMVAMAFPLSVIAASEATTTFKAKFVVPACSVTVPVEVDLGSIGPGQTTGGAFNAVITCPHQARAALYAEAVPLTSLSPASTNRMFMTKADSGLLSGVGLSVHLVGKPGDGVDLTGKGGTDPGVRFCDASGTGARNCALEPRVNVPGDATAGEVTAQVKFTLVMP